MAANPTVEVVLFKLKPGVDEAAFMRVNEMLMPDLRAMRGFVRRELLKSGDGQWLDTVYWDSLDDAMRAAEAFPGVPSAQPLMEMLDMDSVTMLHVHPAKAY